MVVILVDFKVRSVRKCLKTTNTYKQLSFYDTYYVTASEHVTLASATGVNCY